MRSSRSNDYRMNSAIWVQRFDSDYVEKETMEVISQKADERDVYEFFSRVGKVRDVRLIMDCNSTRSKGVGYIEFYDAMSVPMARALSGLFLVNQ
ncbi:hypothetical protein L6452_27569 [Arctium lappa]|uniref:Uncharacterized protein n=1 Tax=Arctium lappa TaxID=4217 RepID=A0ACB8ZWZ4_ARCLA|nr:hypothetical protein L6452_27569 [Arctium lappa]